MLAPMLVRRYNHKRPCYVVTGRRAIGEITAACSLLAAATTAANSWSTWTGKTRAGRRGPAP